MYVFIKILDKNKNSGIIYIVRKQKNIDGEAYQAGNVVEKVKFIVDHKRFRCFATN